MNIPPANRCRPLNRRGCPLTSFLTMGSKPERIRSQLTPQGLGLRVCLPAANSRRQSSLGPGAPTHRISRTSRLNSATAVRQPPQSQPIIGLQVAPKPGLAVHRHCPRQGDVRRNGLFAAADFVDHLRGRPGRAARSRRVIPRASLSSPGAPAPPQNTPCPAAPPLLPAIAPLVYHPLRFDRTNRRAALRRRAGLCRIVHSRSHTTMLNPNRRPALPASAPPPPPATGVAK